VRGDLGVAELRAGLKRGTKGPEKNRTAGYDSVSRTVRRRKKAEKRLHTGVETVKGQ